MRYIAGLISLLLIPFCYKNYFLLFFLVYFFLMFIPPIEKAIKKYLKIELVETAIAVFLIFYGGAWIFWKKTFVLRRNLSILFFLFLQKLLIIFNQIEKEKV